MKKQIGFVLLLLATAIFSCKKDDVEEKSANTVEVQSGTVTIGNITIDIPEGALSKTIQLSARPLSADSYSDAIAAVEFGPDGTEFSEPITVTMPIEKAPIDGVVAVLYHNKQNNLYSAVDFAEVTCNKVTFHINHFSAYLLIPMTQADYEAMTNSVRNDVKSGKSINDVATKYFDYLVKTDNYFNRWTMIGGRYYKANSMRLNMSYKYNNEEHQALFNVSLGAILDNSSPQKTLSDYMFDYNENGQIEVVDQTGKTKEKLFQEHEELYNISINREYKMVDPQMDCKVNGKLEKKNDECELTVKLFCEHSGETYYPNMTYDIDGVSDNGTLELVDKYPTQEGQMPLIYQDIKLRSTDPSLKLSQTTITTDENGEAKVKVKATKDQIKGQIEIVYDYQDEYDNAYVEKSVSFESKPEIWELTVSVSGQPHLIFEGCTADIAYQIKMTIDMSKMDSFSYDGAKYAQMFVDADISISKLSLLSSTVELSLTDIATSTYTVSNLKASLHNPYTFRVQPYDYADGVPTLWIHLESGEFITYHTKLVTTTMGQTSTSEDDEEMEAISFKVERAEGSYTLQRYVLGGNNPLNYYIGDCYGTPDFTITSIANEYTVIATMKKVE